jgi:branched-chain amino acid transport system ATP-binding protein
MGPTVTATLEARGLTAGYGGVPMITDINLHVTRGEVVCLLGANGAGKTTALRALSGELSTMSGQVLWNGTVTKAPLHRRAQAGLGIIPEERSVIKSLSVAQNLRLGRTAPESTYAVMPELRALQHRRGGLLSGGEQQMLAVGRAIANKPQVLLADELSLGLAPKVVVRLLHELRMAAERDNVGVIYVEQRVRQALAYADRGYVISRGKIVMEGTAEELRGRLEEIEESYLSGIAE